MITRSAKPKQIPNWQRQLRDSITDPAELLNTLRLESNLLPGATQASQLFRLRVPRGYVARMKQGDLNDPLLRQVLPLGEETLEIPGFVTDPVGDLMAMPIPGLLHKYHGRVLLITTGTCAIHCRYCFRRHFPYTEIRLTMKNLMAILSYIEADPSIHEVILSGGDPLVLSDRRLSKLAAALAEIPHLRCLRIHTRQPVILPSRVDDLLLSWLDALRLRKVVVIHANHANELDDSVAQALSRLASARVTLLNQTVLLRGINDCLEALQNLSEALFDVGVLPYYLHLLDKVQGAAHFEVTVKRALELVDGLNRILPGYLVPRLVCEQMGALGKTDVRGQDLMFSSQ